MARTKIIRPDAEAMMARPRLFSLLDAYDGRPMLYICGPPGSGKTSLMSSYTAARRLCTLWYEIDEGDSDPAAFFHYLKLAAHHAMGRKITGLPSFDSGNSATIPEFGRRFFTALFPRLPLPAVIVFDNCQEIVDDAPFHELLVQSLPLMPPGLRIAVVSRDEPPPAYARLRANRLLGMIGGDELRLTKEEGETLVRLLGRDVPDLEAIAGLYRRTAGWIVGFQLLLERWDGNGPFFSPGRCGSKRIFSHFATEELHSYFHNEILSRCDSQTRTFLLRTALLPLMTTEVAARVSGMPSADRLLDALRRRNCFVTISPEDASSYQYHPLFRCFLVHEARKEYDQEEWRCRLQDTAVLLRETGQDEEAAVLLAEAKDWQGLSHLLHRLAPVFADQGRYRILSELLDQLPPDALQAEPGLLFWQGIMVMSRKPAAGRIILERAFAAFKEHNDAGGLFLTWSAIIDSFLYERDGLRGCDPWLAEFYVLLGRYGAIPAEVESRVVTSLVSVLVWRCPLPAKLTPWLERAEQLVLTGAADPTQSPLLCCHLAVYHSWIGSRGKAGLDLDLLDSYSGTDLPPMVAVIVHAIRAFRWVFCSFDESMAAVEKGLEISRDNGLHVFDLFLLANGFYCAHATGNRKRAIDFLAAIGQMLPSLGIGDRAHYHCLHAMKSAGEESWQVALAHARTCLQLAEQAGLYFPIAVAHVALLQICTALGEYTEAEEHLAVVLERGRTMGSLFLEFEGLLYGAQLYLEQNQDEQGLQYLEAAMRLGRKQDFFHVPWWVPRSVARLCCRALEAGIEPEYVQEFVRRRGLSLETPPVEIQAWPWAVKIYTLGRFQLVTNGRPVTFRGKAQQKPLLLLKALISFGGRGVKEGLIGDALWPDVDGDMQHQTLTTTLHRLRRLLGYREVITVQDGQLTLNPTLCWVDIWAFERLLGRAEKRNPDDTLGQRAMAEATALYQGEFLPELEDESWTIHTRERLRSRFLRLVEQRGTAFEKYHEFEEAILLYRKGLEVDPLVEQFYQRLMICYKAQGRTGEAVAVFQRCKKILGCMLGIEPSIETKRILKRTQPVVQRAVKTTNPPSPHSRQTRSP